MKWNQPIVGIATITVGAILVAGSFVVGGGDDDTAATNVGGTPTVTSEATEPASTAPPTGACGIDVTSAVFALDPAVVDLFDGNNLKFEALFPGNELAQGISASPIVTASEGVACDLTEGEVRMQGGFQISGPTSEVNFRRLRIELDEGEVYAFFKASGPADFEALDLRLDEAQFTDRGNIVSAVVPMVLDQDATVALNAALGTDFLGDIVELGTVTIKGSRVDAVADPS